MRASLAAVASLWLGVVQAANCTAVYKNPNAAIEDRVADLLKRMTIQEKTAQLIQGDIRDYLNLTDGTLNASGLVWDMEHRANSIWTGLYTTMDIVNIGSKITQDYLMNNTTLG
jgi:beta-glucosidase